MSESIPAPTPSSTLKFPVTDILAGLMAALVTRLAEDIVLRRDYHGIGVKSAPLAFTPCPYTAPSR